MRWHYLVLFKDEQLCGEGKDGFFSPTKKLDPGKYLIADCLVDNVSSLEEGLVSITLVLAEIDRPLPWPADLRLNAPDFGPPVTAISRPGAEQLSAQQRSAIINCICRRYDWAWEHATPEAKQVLGGIVSSEDKARSLVREATDVWRVDHQRAERLIATALELYPKVDRARLRLGEWAIEEGRLDAAVSSFLQEIDQAEKPDHLNAHMYLAVIYEALGDSAAARRHEASASRYMDHPVAFVPAVVERIRAAASHAKPQEHLTESLGDERVSARAGEAAPERPGTELIKSCRTGDADRVQQLLASGANVEDRDEHGHASLHVAAEAGNMEVVKVLINHGAQVNAPTILYGTAINYTPVSAAASRGHLEVTKYLSENGGILYEHDGYMGYFSVMLGAAASGNIELVRYLHEEKKVPIDEADSMGVSPLHMAIEKAHEHIVVYLMGHGANPNIMVGSCSSPIDLTREKIASEKYDNSMKQKFHAILRHLEQPKKSRQEVLAPEKSKKKWWHVWK